MCMNQPVCVCQGNQGLGDMKRKKRRSRASESRQVILRWMLASAGVYGQINSQFFRHSRKAEDLMKHSVEKNGTSRKYPATSEENANTSAHGFLQWQRRARDCPGSSSYFFISLVSRLDTHALPR